MRKININNIEIRKATKNDDLIAISKLIYNTDPYIYPYWFKSLDNCIKILPKLLLEDKFVFHIETFYVVIDKRNKKIIAIASMIDKFTDLEYDYTQLLHYNENCNFVIFDYILPMIEMVKNENVACVTNMCVTKKYRNMHIGYNLLGTLIKDYIKSGTRKEISPMMKFDVLKDNPSAIKLYKNLGFQQSSKVLKGFNGPNMKKPDVVIMEMKFK